MKKFRGKVICVTGSVGKTTTKDAIFTVLNSTLRVRRSQGSMNSEFGLPLTILEIGSGYGSAYKWSWLLLKAFYHSLSRDQSDVLLLEMGVDKPKDMNYLLSLVKPDVAVVTEVAPVHLAQGQFADEDEIFAEKSKLVEALHPQGLAILNIDNPYLAQLAKERRRRSTLTYGTNEKAIYKIGVVETSLAGLSFNIREDEENYSIHCPILGEFNAYALTVALICGLQFGLKEDVILAALERFALPPGRMSLIEGLKETIILDSSYNSSPLALYNALMSLKKLAGGRRKVAVLGNMNELGEKSEKLHKEIGFFVPKYADILITVGKEARWIAQGALEKNMPEGAVFSFSYPQEAIDWFKDRILENDVILVKGSQNRVRLEKFVKMFMLRPDLAEDLLARQSEEWKKIQ